MNCLDRWHGLLIPHFHRTTEAWCWFPLLISPPLICTPPTRWAAIPENPRSGCLKLKSLLETLVVSERVVFEALDWPVLDWKLSSSDASFFGCKWMVSRTLHWPWEEVGSDRWSFFVLRKRPPDPRTLFKAWMCRDSWRYGCNPLRVAW